MFQTNFVEKIKTHILCSTTIFENRNIYEIMCKNIAEPERPQMTTGRMRILCCIPKTTNTHSEYEIPHFPCISGYTKAPQIYVIRILPLSLRYDFCMISSLYSSKATIESIAFSFSYSGIRGYRNSPGNWL
jgi:hypothetical protein